ncbi:MAG: radical SAM protein, partial [Erysipelotrichaceae bacterium]|nr:radical SAM protein [Erysipelotrichaceae bacterium]
MTETKPFSLMVKPAGSSCNMRCQYCYYIDNPESGSRFMSEEVLEQTVRSYAAAASYPVLSYVWHGGEPTLRGIEFYKKAVELQRKYLPEGFECWNSLQTNGLALNDEWCQFLSLNHFDVGISIDGTRAIHDTYRHDAAGNPTYERI